MASEVSENVDIAIVGGGLVGSSLACTLERADLSVVLIEAAETPEIPLSFDQRKLALAQRSIDALGRLGVLSLLRAPPTVIRRIHVSRTGDFGRTLLDAAEFGHPAFGAVVLAQDLGLALAKRVSCLQQTQRICPARVSACHFAAEGARLTLATAEGEKHLSARLVVAADGTDSCIRKAAGIATHTHDYGQTLFVSSLKADQVSDGTAYERFSGQGPVALLPLADGAYGAICGVATADAGGIAKLEDAAYADYFQSRFGWRVGKIRETGKRTSYPLKQVLAGCLHAPGVVLMGNAAQTIHPIGAQGFNLGLRDALGLARILVADGLSAATVEAYAASRQDDRSRTLAFSDGLARMTATPGMPAHLLRSMVLGALGAVPALAAGLVSGAMGYRGAGSFEEVL
mgnify:FL=1